MINLKGREDILDVGCGIGTVPYLIHKIFGDVNRIYGIDIDRNLINWGKTHWGLPKNIHLQYGDVYNINFPDKNFDVITSFGLLEFIENPSKAISEMIRVNKDEGKYITLTIEKSKYVRTPDIFCYNEYLMGLKELGCPIENEGIFIQDLFLHHGIDTKSHEYVLKNSVKITEEYIKLVESTYNAKLLKSMMDFYFQVLKIVGWTEKKYNKYVKEVLSKENLINVYREHIGEEYIQRTPIILLESET